MTRRKDKSLAGNGGLFASHQADESTAANASLVDAMQSAASSHADTKMWGEPGEPKSNAPVPALEDRSVEEDHGYLDALTGRAHDTKALEDATDELDAATKEASLFRRGSRKRLATATAQMTRARSTADLNASIIDTYVSRHPEAAAAFRSPDA